jgi:transposase
VRGQRGDEFSQYPTTSEGYRQFLKRASAWQKAGKEVRVGVESTGNTRYFKSRMEEAGIGVTVINPLKFKVVNESVKKTDKHDAATIAEFLEKDMLPQSRLCRRTSEQIRRLLKARTTLVRAAVVMKNQIHALLTAEGLEDAKGSLQSKRGRKRVLATLQEWENGLVAQPLIETIDRLEENVKSIEGQIRTLVRGDRVVELLLTIPGCGEKSAWAIRAYTDDIKRFANAKKYSAYAGLVPWVQNSNETVRHGKITKRGPEELRTALVQVVMGMRRSKAKTLAWRLMQRYEAMKQSKGSGKSIIATARKLSTIIWRMLSEEAEFDESKMVDQKPAKKAEAMSKSVVLAGLSPAGKLEKIEDASASVQAENRKAKKKTGVARKKKKKSAEV